MSGKPSSEGAEKVIRMSGKPSSEGAEKVIRILDEIANLDKLIEELTPKYQQLRTAETQVANLRTALKRTLGEMDVDTPGNHGFESRLAWLLQEIRRQAGVK